MVFVIWYAKGRSKQTEYPSLLISEGGALLGGGVLGFVDFGFVLSIKTALGTAIGYMESPETDYVQVVWGVFLIVVGMYLRRSVRTRIYVLNMLGEFKHEIGDVKNMESLKLKDYQVKETILDLRWATREVAQAWQEAKVRIEEYVNEFAARSDASTVCFTGMAPIPFEVYAGTCMSGHAVKRFFEYKRGEDVYYELAPGKGEEIGWRVDLPVQGDDSEVVVALSITQTVNETDIEQFSCPRVMAGIDNPKDNAITSVAQLRSLVEETTNLLSQLEQVYPNLRRIHIAGAVPSCYSFELGCKLKHLDNRLPEVVVYHYVSTSRPKYAYAVVVTGQNRGRLLTVKR